MALGDYTPTAWVDGTTPAINATNLGHIETKIDEVDAWSATANTSIAQNTPAGAMTMFAGASVPTGWLLCNGQAVSRTTYSALFTAISTAWGIGDNSSTFNVPDMRESAPVGVGTFSAVVGTTHGSQVAADIYALAGFKDDQEQSHIHKLYVDGGSGATASTDGAGYLRANNVALGRVTSPTTAVVLTGIGASPKPIDVPFDDSVNGAARIGTTTRGKRIGVNFIIKT